MAEAQSKQAVGKAARVRHVAPTIVIGLGGTGKEVLLRLRRRFQERYNLFGFPTMGYLWVDTDTRNTNIDDKPLDHIMEQVMFREEERVNAEVSGEAFMGYFRDQRVSPHIFNWLDQKLAVLGQVVNGAGQVRPLGRLAFFHSYSNIRGKLDKLVAKVRSQSSVELMRDRHGIVVDPNLLDIVIVCSIAGGTGSGMFLDMAFACRQAMSDPDITGYLMLPSIFTDGIRGSEKIYANAYAALKELEYYSLRKDLLERYDSMDIGKAQLAESSRHDFVADWENLERSRGIKPKPIPPPPFNTCYLIDNMTQAGGLIGPKDKSFLCDMIAENIFLNFSSEEFSRTKDSVRANLEQFLGNPLFFRYDEYGQAGGYTEVLAQRYSTIGFSKLYVPVDRIRRACGYQLSLDLLGRWLKGKERNALEIEKYLVERELGNLQLRAGAGGDDIVAALRRVGGRTFDDEIRDQVSAWREQLLPQASEKSPQLYSMVPRLLKDFVRKNFDDSDPRPEKWGEYIKTLRQNRELFVQQVCGERDLSGRRVRDGSILTRVKQWLRDEEVRLPLGIEYLKMLGRILDRHTEELYVKAKETHDRRAANAFEEIRVKLGFVRDEESGWPVQRKSLRVLVDHLCRLMREHLSARMNSFVLGAAIEIIRDEVKPYIGKEELREASGGKQVTDRAGLILELWSLSDALTGINAQLKGRFAAFEKVEEHLIYENLYKEGMFYDYYRIQRAGSAFPVSAKLDELDGLLLQRLGVPNPFDLRELIAGRGEGRAVDEIEDFCYRQFQELEVSADTLEVFERVYPSREERSRRLLRFARNGSVWLKPSKEAATTTQLTQNRADSALISVSAANRERYREVYDELRSLVEANGYKNISYPTTSRSDAVFLYTEYAGVPLAYIRNLEEYYEKAYLPLIRSGAQLHIDYRDEKFTDILIKRSDEIDRTLRANRALLVGNMLRVVNTNSGGNGNVSFSFNSHRDGLSYAQPLGPQGIAVETLKRNDNLLAAIEDEINKRRMRLTPEARLKFFTVLLYHIIDRENPDGFPPGPFAQTHQLTAQGVISYYSPERKALEETQEQEFRLLEQQYGSADSIRAQVRQLYGLKDGYSQEVVINGRRMRVLKEGFDGE